MTMTKKHRRAVLLVAHLRPSLSRHSGFSSAHLLHSIPAKKKNESLYDAAKKNEDLQRMVKTSEEED